MSNNKQAAARYQFSSAVDLFVVLERLGIEHVEVSNERTIVIYQRTIFNVDVLTSHLKTAQTIEVEVFDISPDLDVDTDPLSDRALSCQARYECRCRLGTTRLLRGFTAIPVLVALVNNHQKCTLITRSLQSADTPHPAHSRPRAGVPPRCTRHTARDTRPTGRFAPNQLPPVNPAG